MNSFVSTRALIAITLIIFANDACHADLMIQFKQAGGEVELSWAGTGTSAATTDTTLEFDAFSGPIFNTTGVFNLSTTLTMSVDGAAPFSLPSFLNKLEVTSANSFRIFSDDGGFDSGQPLIIGKLYNALELLDPMGSKLVVQGLNPSDINAGTYTSTSGDSAAFGAVSLSVSGAATVPEPKTIASCMLLLTLGCAMRLRAARPKQTCC